MDCERLGEQLSALADGELAGLAARRLRRHVERCPRCEAELMALRQTRDRLRGVAALWGSAEASRSADLPVGEEAGRKPGSANASVGAPPEFWAAISGQLDAIDATTPPHRNPIPIRAPRPGWAAALALLVVLGAVAAFLITRPAPVTASWVIDRHAHSLPGQASDPRGETLVSSSPNVVSEWLSRQLGRQVPPIDLELVSLELRGAMAGSAEGRRFGLMRYHRGAERWSLLVLPGGGTLADGRETTAGRYRFRTAASGGTRMAAWHSEGSLFLLAASATNEELLRAARQAARACEIGR